MCWKSHWLLLTDWSLSYEGTAYPTPCISEVFKGMRFSEAIRGDVILPSFPKSGMFSCCTKRIVIIMIIIRTDITVARIVTTVTKKILMIAITTNNVIMMLHLQLWNVYFCFIWDEWERTVIFLFANLKDSTINFGVKLSNLFFCVCFTVHCRLFPFL